MLLKEEDLNMFSKYELMLSKYDLNCGGAVKKV